MFLNVTFTGWTEQLPDTPVEESTPASESTEKIKKRYRKKKNKLEETFPAYLQVKLSLCFLCININIQDLCIC